MKPAPFATPEDEPEPVRIPEECGQLLPPARRPPTAVGTATPRPRDRPGPPIPPKASRLTRIAHSMFGTGLLVGGIALATLPALAAALGVGMALLGAEVIARAPPPSTNARREHDPLLAAVSLTSACSWRRRPLREELCS